jgi:hypothetical protein
MIGSHREGNVRYASADTVRGMGTWYWIGVCVGIGVAVGVLHAAFWGKGRESAILVSFSAVVIGLLLGWVVSNSEPGTWADRGGAVAGAMLGLIGAVPVVVGALRRGGTRSGTVLLLAGAALVLAGIAFIPVAGFLIAIVLPILALLLRRRRPERYAGLRTLAKD